MIPDEIVKEFEERWNYASFTWNSDNASRIAFAKSTHRKIISFLRTSLEEYGKQQYKLGREEYVETFGKELEKEAYERGLELGKEEIIKSDPILVNKLQNLIDQAIRSTRQEDIAALENRLIESQAKEPPDRLYFSDAIAVLKNLNEEKQ